VIYFAATTASLDALVPMGMPFVGKTVMGIAANSD
jgi:hypothetical protein